MQLALKCADLGHASAPWDLHLRWLKALEEEMFLQVRQAILPSTEHLTKQLLSI